MSDHIITPPESDGKVNILIAGHYVPLEALAQSLADAAGQLFSLMGREGLAAEHERQVAERAWDEGFRAGRGADHNSMWWPKNPYGKGHTDA